MLILFFIGIISSTFIRKSLLQYEEYKILRKIPQYHSYKVLIISTEKIFIEYNSKLKYKNIYTDRFEIKDTECIPIQFDLEIIILNVNNNSTNIYIEIESEFNARCLIIGGFPPFL